MQITLREFMPGPDGWGYVQGRQMYEKLRDVVEAHPAEMIFTISLKGVEHTDASFPRESVVELAKSYRGRYGFCLKDATDPDLLDNWDAAALKREQPLIVWRDDTAQILGPQPGEGIRQMLDYILSTPSTTTS
ncbi:MAG: DNA-binding protein, partial [Ktedonobacteraceae bacterium]